MNCKPPIHLKLKSKRRLPLLHKPEKIKVTLASWKSLLWNRQTEQFETLFLMKITTDCSFLKKTNIFTVTGCQVSSASSIKLMKGSRVTGRLFWKHIFPISMRIEKMLRSSNLFTGDERNLGKIIWLRWSFFMNSIKFLYKLKVADWNLQTY